FGRRVLDRNAVRDRLVELFDANQASVEDIAQRANAVVRVTVLAEQGVSNTASAGHTLPERVNLVIDAQDTIERGPHLANGGRGFGGVRAEASHVDAVSPVSTGTFLH